MTGGEPIVWLILSSKFLPVATLLLIFVPAELLRILAETISMPLLARREVRLFTLNYVLTAVTFVGTAALLVAAYGLIGAALAYALGNLAYAAMAWWLVRRRLAFRVERATLAGFVAAFALLGAVGLVSLEFPFGLMRLLLAALCCGLWLALALRKVSPREILSRLRANPTS